jgi:two-component system sensor histidine kinase BarA
MRRPVFTKISLAAKCQILFGGAVLSIVAATLIIPGIRMGDLTHERYLRIAKEAATVALLSVDLQGQDWTKAQEQLNRAWPKLLSLGEEEFPVTPPTLIPVEQARLQAAAGYQGFITETVAKLRTNRQALYQFKIDEYDDGRDHIRLAMAVRASEADKDPGSLKGLIEVKVPIDPESGLINIGVLVASLCCGAVLALLVFYLVTQKLLLSPVRKLRRLAEAVTTGEMEARSTIATGDEFEDLGNAFNDMLVHLLSTQEELRKSNKSLDTRLGELAETNVALFESNKLKSEFIANVSHELRTPLVSIIGFAELLVDFGDNPPTDNTRYLRYTRNILTSGRMLLDIINDLLDLAKIEAGKLELHIVEVDPAESCRNLIDFVTPLADKKALNLTLDMPDELPRMSTDSGRLKQILYNLLSNAIKFTPDGGAVTLAVHPDGDEYLTFSVTDTGPGISEAEQQIIFEKFRQIDSSVTRDHAGTGLGLAITRELCALLGGSVTVRSVPGTGSTFTVRLPQKAPVDAQVPLVNLT